MTDLAELGFVVRTGELAKAEQSLNRLTPAGARAERAAAGVSRASDKMGQQIERSLAPLRNLQRLMQVVAAGALVQFARRQLEAADAIGKAAEVASLTTDTMQELRYAFTSLADVADGEVDAALRRFNRRLGLARAGAGPAKQAFDSMFGGVSQFGNTEQALEAVIQKISAVEDQAIRAAMASAYFGDDAGPLLAAALGKGSAAIDQLRRDAHDLGIVLDSGVIARADEIRSQFDKASRILSTHFMNAVVAVTPYVVRMAEAANDFATHWQRAMGFDGQPFAKEIKHYSTEVESLQRMIAETEGKLGRVGSGPVERLLPDGVLEKRRKVLFDALAEQNQALLVAQHHLDMYQKKRDVALGGGGPGGGGDDQPAPGGVPDDVMQQYIDLEAKLQQQVALHGETSEAAKLRYEFEHGALKGLNAEQQARLEGLAAELDALALAAEKEKELADLKKEIEQGRLDHMDPVERERERYAQQLLNLEIFREEEGLKEEEYRALALQAEANHQAALTEINKSGLDKRARDEKLVNQARLRERQAFFNNLSALMYSHSRTAFELGKVAAISNTIITTREAAMNAYKALAGIPVVGPALGAAAAAAATAAGVANIQSINSTQFGSGGGGTATYPTGPGGTAPNTPGGPYMPQQQEQQPAHVTIQLDSRRSRYTREEVEDILEGLNELAKDGAQISQIVVR